MPRCSVSECKNNDRRTKGEDIVYHSFPRDEPNCTMWIHQTKRQDMFELNYACVCSEHFDAADYKRDLEHELLGLPPRRKGMLRNDAVPHKNIPSRSMSRQVKKEAKVKQEVTELDHSGNYSTRMEIKEEPLVELDEALLTTSDGKKNAQDPLAIESQEKSRQHVEDALETSTCIVCEKVFRTKKAMLNHKKICKGKLLNCDICNKGFCGKSAVVRHMKIHTREKTYYCDKCGKDFTQKSAFKKHMKIHTRIISYTCDICRNSFADKYGYQKHLLEHRRNANSVSGSNSEKTMLKTKKSEAETVEKLVPGSVSEETAQKKGEVDPEEELMTSEELQDVIKEVHTVVMETPLETENVAQNAQVMQQEVYKFDSEKNEFYSSSNEKIFYSECDLMKHLSATHEKPFACHLCEKRYKQKMNLREHIMAHSGDKLHQCTTCHKKFAVRRYLQRHMMVHTGDKPFSCDLCNKCFAYKRDMEDHSRIHTGEKPFECIVCKKRFCQKKILQSHIKKHSKELSL